MSLSAQFLDELRARTTLSALICSVVKLEKAGREHKGCCPFHQEKTPSFTVSDDKGFYHCFGCGAHGDAIRWLTDARGLPFIDAVKELAAAAGMEVPAPSAEAQARAEKSERVSEVLETAAAWYAEQLAGDKKILALLAERGVGAEQVERFGLGLAPAKRSVAACGVAPTALEAAGLLIEDPNGYRDRFRGRIMIPLRDARGRIAGFSARATGDAEPKYLNSPESAAFAKGDMLFNLDRAAAAARASRRLLIVEGQFDAIALDKVGIGEAVAPMGTALTERQLERAWRAAYCPILLLDGDKAGRKAALRACERAMPHVGPGGTLAIALLAEGEDPDSLVRSAEDGRAAAEAVIAAARPLSAWLWETLQGEYDTASPEGRARLWDRLAKLAGAVRDAETKAQYLAEWRRSFDTRFPPAPPGLADEDMAPDGKVVDLSGLREGERANLRSVAGAWLERERERMPGRLAAMPAKAAGEAAGRWAWEAGRRAGAGLVPAEDAAEALDEIAEARYAPDVEQLRRSFWFGCRRAASLVETMRIERRCALYHRTDKGNSERWIARYGEDYLYTTAKGWLGWDRRRYRVLNQEKDTTPAEVLASVVRMIEAIQREADFVEASGWPDDEEIDPDLFDKLDGVDPRRPGGLNRIVPGGKKPERLSAKLRAWALASEASGRINCIPGLVKRDVTVELTDFDTDPMVLNCLNGTLHFIRADEAGPDRVELRSHDRADRLTKVTACKYDAGAAAPQFRKLVHWAQPNRDRRRYLRQWMGYNLTGDMGEQIFHVWWGPTAANGKSTVGNACREAVGDYGITIKPEVFLEVGLKKGGDAATPALVQLPGARCVTSGEPPKDASIDEALINTITGGDAMQARDNFRSFFNFLPIFKWTLWCNRLPPIPQGTEGIWRRVKVMLWESHLEPHEKDRELPQKLRAEMEGILAWMVRGAIDWMEHGFIEPESVQVASAEYKQDSDPMSIFLRTCTEPEPGGRVQGSELYKTFEAWATAANEVVWKPKGFTQALKAKGVVTKHSNGTHWLGIRLTKSPDDFVDGEGKVKKLTIDDGEGQGDDPPPAATWQRGPPPIASPDDDEDDFKP